MNDDDEAREARVAELLRAFHASGQGPRMPDLKKLKQPTERLGQEVIGLTPAQVEALHPDVLRSGDAWLVQMRADGERIEVQLDRFGRTREVHAVPAAVARDIEHLAFRATVMSGGLVVLRDLAAVGAPAQEIAALLAESRHGAFAPFAEARLPQGGRRRVLRSPRGSLVVLDVDATGALLDARPVQGFAAVMLAQRVVGEPTGGAR